MLLLVGVDQDRPPVELLESEFGLSKQNVKRFGRCDVVERERKFAGFFERIVIDDVEAELAGKRVDGQLEARPFVEFYPMRRLAPGSSIRRLNVVTGRR